jgi:hypothetical protein
LVARQRGTAPEAELTRLRDLASQHLREEENDRNA